MEKRKEEGMEKFLRVILIGIGVAAAASLGLLCLAAEVCLRMNLGTGGPVLTVCALSCLVGGMTAANLGGSRKLPVALAVMLGWFLVWLVIGCTGGGTIDTAEGLRHLAAGLAGGLFGGVLAAHRKKSRK